MEKQSVIRYGLTIENRNLAIQKAKSKNDGIYTFRGFIYRVKEHQITHYAYFNEILQCFGTFDVAICNFDTYDNARKLLKKI